MNAENIKIIFHCFSSFFFFSATSIMMLMITVHTEREIFAFEWWTCKNARKWKRRDAEEVEKKKIVNYDVSDDNELVCWEMNFQYFYLKRFLVHALSYFHWILSVKLLKMSLLIKTPWNIFCRPLKSSFFKEQMR